MYRYYRKVRMNQNSSATADDPIEMGDLLDDEENQEDNIYFEIVPGQNEISEEETLEALSTMDIEDIKAEYYRLMKISEVNEEIMNQYDEKLEKQDREAELQMTTAESVQTENDKWMKKQAEAKRKHKNFKDEASRIKCEHITYQTEAVMLEEKCEALKPDIRKLVEEIEELRAQRKLFDEAMGANVEQITEEAEKLVKQNEKNYEILGKLKLELNKLKLDLLEDNESEGDDVDENPDSRIAEAGDTKMSPLPSLLSGAFDIDLIGTPSIDPIIDTPRGEVYTMSSFKMMPDGSVHPSATSCDKVGTNIGTSKKSVRFNLVDTRISCRYEVATLKTGNAMPPSKPNIQHWVVADTRCTDNGMKTTSDPIDIIRDKNKSVESVRQIHRKQQAMRMYKANEKICMKPGNDTHSLEENRFFKELQPIASKLGIEKNMKVESRTQNLVPVPPPTNMHKTSSMIRKSISKEPTAHQSQVFETKPGQLGESTLNIGTAYNPPGLARHATIVPNIASRSGPSQENIRRKLPPIKQQTTKGQNKKGLKLKSISVENALPCIAANNKIRENGIICDVPATSPRPVYTEKSVHKAGVTKTNKLTCKMEKISPSEAKAIEVGKNKAEKGIKLLGDRKILIKR